MTYSLWTNPYHTKISKDENETDKQNPYYDENNFNAADNLKGISESQWN